MYSALKMMNCAFKMMNYAFKMMNLYSKWWTLGGARAGARCEEVASVAELRGAWADGEAAWWIRELWSTRDRSIEIKAAAALIKCKSDGANQSKLFARSSTSTWSQANDCDHVIAMTSSQANDLVVEEFLLVLPYNDVWNEKSLLVQVPCPLSWGPLS